MCSKFLAAVGGIGLRGNSHAFLEARASLAINHGEEWYSSEQARDICQAERENTCSGQRYLFLEGREQKIVDWRFEDAHQNTEKQVIMTSGHDLLLDQ